MEVLPEVNEKMDRRYELKRRGHTVETTEQRVLDIYQKKLGATILFFSVSAWTKKGFD